MSFPAAGAAPDCQTRFGRNEISERQGIEGDHAIVWRYAPHSRIERNKNAILSACISVTDLAVVLVVAFLSHGCRTAHRFKAFVCQPLQPNGLSDQNAPEAALDFPLGDDLG